MNYVKIIEKNKNFIELELVNDDHSLSNLVKEILLSKDGVILASYGVEHPVLDPDTGRYISNPTIMLKTDEKTDAEAVLKEALKDIVDLCNKTLEDL
ncbi:DNA-directed RNA polymerase subunit L [Methanococcus maripaludis]|uniref:DNA-directed RNA polymerase subunit Rpo11 n=1 Tax=Methanococcus maripaludis TaxID=39152 RepID=A0A7J9PC24_METMI|nr:DNA-directed RNA polymerase subunit L [Methanococcus maripaludis]MBA2840664.1 DNA-directed RNA polymerase subunit L [Methanococcus maripaludis]MBA2853218.1 DNA-directed RNA polymerase subunit L [Methanococcus maripaludis]MBA2860364.1 DNA-directed RNA polymerase subunit L [Methanococcus maripaludis]MBA2869172.1 DNA-directed RNA polymerase subunit L [Methanococcus maripaludis]MBB6401830.1 DNA-directed RNA polymerase subunit L [Methanococcus maripaludis]